MCVHACLAFPKHWRCLFTPQYFSVYFLRSFFCLPKISYQGQVHGYTTITYSTGIFKFQAFFFFPSLYPGSNLGPEILFIYLVSLISINLEQFLILSLYFLTLTFLQITAGNFVESSSFWVCLMFPLDWIQVVHFWQTDH